MSRHPALHLMLHMLLILLMMGSGPAAFAQTSAQLRYTNVRLVPETRAPAPGKDFTVAIVLTPEKGWHTYWKNPGDAGGPPAPSWRLPRGVTVDPLRFPVPTTYLVSDVMNHVYEGENILLAQVHIPADLAGALPIGLRLDWLVCSDRLCVPEGADLSLDLMVGDGAADPAGQPLFERARHAMPRVLFERGTFARDEGKVRFAVPLARTEDVTAAHFFPHEGRVLRYAPAQTVKRTENAIIIEAEAARGVPPSAVSGVLRVERGPVTEGFEVTLSEGPVPTGTAIASGMGLPALAGIIGLSVLGGLVLNLLPCVFPILSLKAMGVARSGRSQADARREGVFYTAGVILVCLFLGGAALALAAAGKGAGWAFQLQNPRIILFLLLLTLAIGLNFAGLFEVTLRVTGGEALARQDGAKGAFWTGALAAFVATPCTGPFMAGALGAALVLPWHAGLFVFAGLGFGLALPFLLLGFIPALQRLLPRPGAWMLTFRRILAIPMLLTSLALAWILGRQAGVDGMSAGLAIALLFALFLWWAGLRQARGARPAIPAILAVLALVVMPIFLPLDRAETTPATEQAGYEIIPFSEATLARLREEGQPVFLYFTADWCLTCKVNEHGPLASRKVAEHFRDKGIRVMVGDWTSPDDRIARFLEAHGRAGIPFYLFYAPNREAVELPQLLTTGALTALG